VARLAAEMVALRQPATHHPGLHRLFQRATWLWAGIFLLLTTSLAVMMRTEPAGEFLMLSTVVTIALVAAGAGASALWFLRALPRLGLSLRFAPAVPHPKRAGRNALRGRAGHAGQSLSPDRPGPVLAAKSAGGRAQ
jgi:hypothetical protein